MQVGTIVGFYISGLLYDWVGWEAVFYIQGGACLVWLLFWLLLTSDTPASHPSYGPRPSPATPVSPAVCRISDKERQYIEAGLPATDKDSVAIPWKGIWTSMAFWAILVANFANNWGFHLLLTELPQYLSEIFPDYMNTGTKQGE